LDRPWTTKIREAPDKTLAAPVALPSPNLDWYPLRRPGPRPTLS
jgi:hypothetical protein